MTFSERGGWWVVGEAAIIGLYIVALLGTTGIDEGTGTGFAQIVGVVLVAFAIVVGAWSLVLHGNKITLYPYPPDGATLIAAGPYRLVRHPIDLAVVSGAVGLGLVALSPAGILVGLTMIPFFGAKVGFEEDALVESVPGYREYRSAIPYRIIPRVM
jgi:protein-S-isoprenylcysteine O-methyltransferase Ste14